MSIDLERLADKYPDATKELLELTEALKSKELQREGQESFIRYVKHIWPDFIEGTHHKIFAEKLERVAKGELKRLIYWRCRYRSGSGSTRIGRHPLGARCFESNGSGKRMGLLFIGSATKATARRIHRDCDDALVDQRLNREAFSETGGRTRRSVGSGGIPRYFP